MLNFYRRSLGLPPILLVATAEPGAAWGYGESVGVIGGGLAVLLIIGGVLMYAYQQEESTLEIIRAVATGIVFPLADIFLEIFDALMDVAVRWCSSNITTLPRFDILPAHLFSYFRFLTP